MFYKMLWDLFTAWLCNLRNFSVILHVEFSFYGLLRDIYAGESVQSFKY